MVQGQQIEQLASLSGKMLQMIWKMYVSVIPILNLQACFTKLSDKFLPCATHCIHFYLYLCHHKKHYTLSFLVKLLAYSKKDFLNQPINPETSQTGLSLQGNGVHRIDPISSVVPKKVTLKNIRKWSLAAAETSSWSFRADLAARSHRPVAASARRHSSFEAADASSTSTMLVWGIEATTSPRV